MTSKRFSMRTRNKALLAAAAGAVLPIHAGSLSRVAAADPVEVRLMTWMGKEGLPDFEAALGEFAKAHPEITIKHESIPGGGAATYPDVLRTAIASGDPPDVFWMWGGSLAAPYIESGQIIPLDDYYAKYKWADRCVPWVMESFKKDDKTWGLPHAANGMGFWYRKDVFEEQGIEIPKTYAELEAMCTKLKDNNIAALSMGGQYGWNTMRLLDYFLELKAGPEMHDALNKLEASWNSPEVVEAYTLLKTWTDNGWIVEGFLAVPPEDARIPWYAGDAAMVFEGSWLEGTLKDHEQDLTKYDFFVPPTDQEPVRISAFAEQYMIAKDAKHPDEAAVFMDWVTNPDNQMANYDAIGGLTGIVGVSPDPEEWALTAKWAELIEGAEAYPPTDQAFSNELMDTFFAIQDGIVGGQITPEDGAKQMEEQAEAWRQSHPAS